MASQSGPKPAPVPPAAGPLTADKVLDKPHTTVHTEYKSSSVHTSKAPAKKHSGPTDEEKKQFLKIAGAVAAGLAAIALGVAGYKACTKDDKKKEAENKVDEGKNWLGQKVGDAKRSAHHTKEVVDEKAAKAQAKLEETAAAKKLAEAKEKADKKQIEMEKKAVKASGEYDTKVKQGYVKTAETAGNVKDAVDRNPVVKEVKKDTRNFFEKLSDVISGKK